VELSVNREGSKVPHATARKRASRLSFGEVLGVHALTYVDLDLLLQEGEENGDVSSPEGSAVEGAFIPDSLVGRAWSSLGALVQAIGRHARNDS